MNRRFGFSGASLGIEGFVEYLQLLDRLGGLTGLGELVGQHEPDIILSRAKIGELLECLERVGVPACAVHTIRVLEEVFLGVAVEALLGRDLTKLVVDLMARRRVTQDLVAESDGVVQIAAIRV